MILTSGWDNVCQSRDGRGGGSRPGPPGRSSTAPGQKSDLEITAIVGRGIYDYIITKLRFLFHFSLFFHPYSLLSFYL